MFKKFSFMLMMVLCIMMAAPSAYSKQANVKPVNILIDIYYDNAGVTEARHTIGHLKSSAEYRLPDMNGRIDVTESYKPERISRMMHLKNAHNGPLKAGWYVVAAGVTGDTKYYLGLCEANGSWVIPVNLNDNLITDPALLDQLTKMPTLN